MNLPPLRIVITTKHAKRHQLFLSLACERLGSHLAGIMIQGAPPQKSKKKSSPVTHLVHLIKEKLPFLRGIYKRWFDRKPRKNYEDYLEQALGYVREKSWKNFEIPCSYTANINSAETLQQLRDWKPDLILVFGGGILKQDWLTLPRLGTINLHTGILPYYRSCNSNHYALYQEQEERTGSTLHYVDAGVDTGQIIQLIHTDSKKFDNFDQFRGRLFADGLEALIAIAEKVIAKPERLPAHSAQAPESYYPHACYHHYVERVADFRLYVNHHYPWPSVLHTSQRPQGAPSLKTKNLPNGITILLYHGLSDPANRTEDEMAFSRIQTDTHAFQQQMAWLSQHGEPLKLSDVPALLQKGPVKKPYFVITFDDAFSSIKTQGVALCREHNIVPTVFVCSRFASRERVNYRVLLALLLKKGAEQQIRSALFSLTRLNLDKTANLLDACKAHYCPYLMEQVVHQLWQELCGPIPQIHLSWNELNDLQREGWQMGNHTLSHVVLGKLNSHDQAFEIEENDRLMQANGLQCLPWLSFPYGSAHDVNSGTHAWLQSHPDWFGIFAKGGVNTFYSRTQWLRTGIGPDSFTLFKQKMSGLK